MRKYRWILVTLAFLVLIVHNVRLQVQKSKLTQRRTKLQVRLNDQMQAIHQARSQNSGTLQLNANEKQQMDRLHAMLSWVKEPEDFLVRSGDQVVSHIHSVTPGHVRMLIYLPESATTETPCQLKFGYAELWNARHSVLKQELQDSDLKIQEMGLHLKFEKLGVHAIDFKMADPPALQVIVNEEVQHSFPIKPFQRRPGSSFGPYFTKAFPNQIYGWTKSRGNQKMSPRHMLVDHTFDMQSKLGNQTMHRGIKFQCWLDSTERVSISAAYAAAYLQTIVDELTQIDCISLDDVDDLFEPYQGDGRLFFREEIHDRRSLVPP